MMIKARIRRAAATVVGLAMVGSLTALVGPSVAQAADRPLTSATLLTAGDLAHAGWASPSAAQVSTDDGAMLGVCQMAVPYWSDGFQSLQRRGFETGTPYVTGVEMVMGFTTSHAAADYEHDYRATVSYACLDAVGPRRWDVRSATTLTLRHTSEHAHTFTVGDTTGTERNLSITVIRDGARVAVVWLVGGDDDPARSLDLHRLAQRAATRMVA